MADRIRAIVGDTPSDSTGHKNYKAMAADLSVDQSRISEWKKGLPENYGNDVWNAAAFILGTQQTDLTMADLCTEVHQNLHG